MSDKTLPERMREAAKTMEEARRRLPLEGYSSAYDFDIDTLHLFANKWEEEDNIRNAVRNYFINGGMIKGTADRAAERLLENFDVSLKVKR